MRLITRRRLLTTSLGLGAAAALGASFTLALSRGSRTLKRIERTAEALGTKVHITILHGDEREANIILNEAFQTLDEFETALSVYRPRGCVGILNREGKVLGPLDDLCECLDRARHWSSVTDGAFDVTVQPLWQVYAEAQRQGRLPEPQAIEAAKALVNWREVHSDPSKIWLGKPRMGVTFNGIAQGLAADRVRWLLKLFDVKHALIDVGELAALGDKQGEPWKAGIQHPRIEDAYAAVTALDARCLATSGDYSSSFSADHRANHIIDPRTGRSPSEFASVSILAPTGCDADALSTSVFVLGFERGVELIRSTPDVDAFIVFKDGRTFATKGFPQV